MSDSGDSLITYSKWFEIEEAKACEVVKRWREWMRTDPYYNRNLRPTEEARVARYAKNADLIAAMIVQVEKDKTIRREGRDVRNKVLEDIDIYIATFFFVPFMLFRISGLSLFASASGLVLANSAMLGVYAVLFAV